MQQIGNPLPVAPAGSKTVASAETDSATVSHRDLSVTQTGPPHLTATGFSGGVSETCEQTGHEGFSFSFLFTCVCFTLQIKSFVVICFLMSLTIWSNSPYSSSCDNLTPLPIGQKKSFNLKLNMQELAFGDSRKVSPSDQTKSS